MNIFSYDIDNKILESKKFLQFEKKINEEKDSKKKGEKELQEFIFNFPTLFPVSEISGNETSIWIPLAQEIELDTGRLDIFATDGVGNIYIIECKLNSNHEMKTIRSQLDNYAAGISDKIKNLGLDDFWIWFREEIKKNSKNQQTLEKIIEEKIGKDDVESVLKSMKNNLKENRNILVFAVDKITSNLRVSIDWWNNSVDTSTNYPTFALEVRQYDSDKSNNNVDVSVQTYPFNLEKIKMKIESKSGKRKIHENDEKTWTRNFEQNEFNYEQKNEIIEFTKDLIKLVKVEDKGILNFGTGGEGGRMMPRFSRYKDRSPIGLKTNGKLIMQFDLIQGCERGPDAGNKFEREISKIEEINASFKNKSGGGSNKEPGLNPETWLPYKDKILSILKEIFMND
jgi:hypothetical protein